jgi:hypothetical protein
MAYSDFQTALTAAATAFDSGDYATARRKVTLARIYLAGIPNSTADGVSAQWRTELESLENSINIEEARTTPAVTMGAEFAP